MIRFALGVALGLALLTGTSALAAEQPAAPVSEVAVTAAAAPAAVPAVALPASLLSFDKQVKACPTAPQSRVGGPLADDLSEAVEQESSNLRLPKICPVDCTPCNTPADCIIGGCKAIQCP